MKRLLFLAGMTVASLLLITQGAFAAADNACTAAEVARGKATICHHPPGNPTNASTLCVGIAAVPAHLANHPGDSLGACAGPPPCDPTQVECCTAADCADDGNVCTTATCVNNQCGTDPVAGCCDTPTDCPTPGNTCLDATCVNNTCGTEDNGTCCCQQFIHPDCGGTDEANHCFPGCDGCTGQCITASTCEPGGAGSTTQFPASTCTGFCE